jgi:probable phosphoglycerate mutase
MRHGESRANTLGIILSNPKNGMKKEFGLTDTGKKQATQAIRQCNVLNANTMIVSSDFSRARETATIAKKLLGTTAIRFSRRLRERNFGHFEKTSDNNYGKIWAADRMKERKGEMTTVESVHHVLGRATLLILSLEKQFHDRDILLVSHGDTLQILITGFLKKDLSLHRDQEHLKTAEIRQLRLA